MIRIRITEDDCDALCELRKDDVADRYRDEAKARGEKYALTSGRLKPRSGR